MKRFFIVLVFFANFFLKSSGYTVSDMQRDIKAIWTPLIIQHLGVSEGKINFCVDNSFKNFAANLDSLSSADKTFWDCVTNQLAEDQKTIIITKLNSIQKNSKDLCGNRSECFSQLQSLEMYSYIKSLNKN